MPSFINNKLSSLENLSFQLINKVHLQFGILPEMLFKAGSDINTLTLNQLHFVDLPNMLINAFV